MKLARAVEELWSEEVEEVGVKELESRSWSKGVGVKELESRSWSQGAGVKESELRSQSKGDELSLFFLFII